MKLLKTFVFASLIGVYGFAMAGDKVANPLLPKVEVKQDPKFEVSRPLSDKRYRELTTLKSRPMRSPMTRQIINVAVEDPESKDTDADLCPHYNGKIMVYTPIVLDPWSGLACYREHLGKPLDDETKQWVEKTLTPRLNRALSGIVGSKYSVSDNMVQDFFNHQENLPDTMRCSHALAYYTQIKAASSVRARLAWLTAWAYRRGINSPISGPYLMDSIRAVLKNISSDKSTEVDLQRRINRLA
ncbi:MAG: hypothetical protein JXQ25_07230, partial [Deltaproteobacteria bacterium]|nr:hypothetical protein [Deltaproteobacteria bacterium]